MSHLLRLAILMSGLALAVAGPAGAQWRDARTIGLEAAKTIADAAQAEAATRGRAVSIVVLDDAGRVVLSRRMDGARYTSLELARNKAETVLVIGRETRAAGEGLEAGGLSILAIEGATPFAGGLPIRDGDVLAGAVGVSGAPADVDEAIAQAGLDAVFED